MTVFGIFRFFGWYFGNLNEKCSVIGISVTCDGKIQFLIENTTVTVFIQKSDYGIMVILEKINGNAVIQNLVQPPCCDFVYLEQLQELYFYKKF